LPFTAHRRFITGLILSEAKQRLGIKTGRVRVASLSQLDSLVGDHVTGDPPQVAWQDSFGLYQFTSYEEAVESISHAYYRLFQPDLDWETATIEEVRRYPTYSTDLMAAWNVVEHLSAESRQPEIRRQGEFWRAAFSGAEAFAGTPALAICLAALRVRGIDPVFCDDLLDEDIPSPIDSGRESETVDFL
jgi:hypothetical protein